ncbi:hypothetical protein HYW35_00950 [Candidatus Saccharibacteria bacterium]|nr:hypothetical protein [Candidatus Saccharibacteria bacterium]
MSTDFFELNIDLSTQNRLALRAAGEYVASLRFLLKEHSVDLFPIELDSLLSDAYTQKYSEVMNAEPMPETFPQGEVRDAEVIQLQQPERRDDMSDNVDPQAVSESKTLKKIEPDASSQRMRSFLENVYGHAEIVTMNDEEVEVAFTRLMSELPGTSNRKSIETQIRRVRRWASGERVVDIAAEEWVTPPAISIGRRSLVESSKKVPLQNLRDRLVDGTTNTVDSEAGESIQEIILGIRDKIVEEKRMAMEALANYKRPFNLHPNFEAEAVTAINVTRRAVSTLSLIRKIFRAQLETENIEKVRSVLLDLCERGFVINQGRDVFTTPSYNIGDHASDLKKAAATNGFKLPDDFEERVLALFADKPTVHVAEITRDLFGDRLPPGDFAIVVDKLQSIGGLRHLKAGYYGTAGSLSESTSPPTIKPVERSGGNDNNQPKRSLKRMIHDAGIHQTSQPVRRHASNTRARRR